MKREKFKLKKILFIGILSTAFLIATHISLIFYSVPKFIYLNIIGIFLFTLYFKLVPSLVLLSFYQLFLLYYNQTENFFSYNFILGTINIIVISSTTIIIKNKYLSIIISTITMSLTSKVISIKIISLFSNENIYNNSVINLKSDLVVYLFSATITAILLFIIENINLKGVNYEKIKKI